MTKIKFFFIKLKIKIKNYIKRKKFEKEFKSKDPFIYK
jgi:hypothetical protein